MKIVILVEILLISLANTSAQKTITCQVYSPRSSPGCSFSEITIQPNETVSIKTDPEDYDANKIVSVGIGWSTIHSVPREIFTKFPNVTHFFALGQRIQEIKPDTFKDAKKLEFISLEHNKLRFLHRDTFQGKNYCRPGF